MEHESIKGNVIVAPTGGLFLSIQQSEGYCFRVHQAYSGGGGRSSKSYKCPSSAFALAGNEHTTSRLARRPRMFLPMGVLTYWETVYLLDSKGRAESFVFRNTRSMKAVWVKNDPHDLVPESDEIQEGIKVIHSDRACEPK
jgi:hypothetical protein